jgi:hypothetical protein
VWTQRRNGDIVQLAFLSFCLSQATLSEAQEGCMTNQRGVFISATFLTLTLAACSGNEPNGTVPTSPTPARAAEPAYTLSGVIVAETPTGLAPVEGVMVQINMLKPATTDADGFCSIPGMTLTGLAPNVAVGNFNAVTAWKPTFLNDTRVITIRGDTRHDIHLIRRPTFTLSGVVSEMTASGLTPVEGVQVDGWSCDPAFPGNRPPTPSDGCNYGRSLSTTSDRSGRYSLSGVYAARNVICAMRAIKATWLTRNVVATRLR